MPAPFQAYAQEVTEAPKPLGPDALLRQRANAQKRHREGYAEGASSLHSALPAAAFIASDTPVELLGQFSRCAPCITDKRCAAASASLLQLHPQLQLGWHGVGCAHKRPASSAAHVRCSQYCSGCSRGLHNRLKLACEVL